MQFYKPDYLTKLTLLKPLNPKQERFCKEYLIDFNATQAAIRAGYSKQTAYSIGQRLLKNVEVKRFLESKGKQLATKLEISQERTLREIARMAYSDIRNIYNNDGSVKAVHELDDDTAAAISSVEIDEQVNGKSKVKTRTKKFRFHDKTKAVEMLAKHFHIYQDITPTVVVNNQIDLSKLTADELLALLNLKKKIAA